MQENRGFRGARGAHERGKGEESFSWSKRTGDQKEWEKDSVDCSSIFVEPMKWMQTVQDGYVEEKLLHGLQRPTGLLQLGRDAV
ncbi:hypothetical protein MLD38_010080 [Melastoma candidum]|uniref:Uncharacterized protein n=2 Tax=Melastoma candidum TaxID=119954 RepID=A0ACB9QYT9_9MYRT|nr:hypothetical protein MLD38_010073 [Melastoma candidum]KAI4371768.1 hypothetical protein MLD38_010080 [Melastoma candidum]